MSLGKENIIKSIVNLTPHDVVIYDRQGKEPILTIPPSGVVTRVSVTPKGSRVINVDGKEITIRKIEYGEITNLPDPKEGTIYIVSSIVLQALKYKGIKREDVLAVDSNPDSAIRDEKGRIKGVKFLMTL